MTMFHDDGFEELLLSDNYLPTCKSDVQKALKFRYTKLLNFWLFSRKHQILRLVNETLGKKVSLQVEKNDLFGFAFCNSYYAIHSPTIPNFTNFFMRYLTFGVNFNVKCPRLTLSEEDLTMVFRHAQTINRETELWLLKQFNGTIPAQFFHEYRLQNIPITLSLRQINSEYVSKLIDIKSPYYKELIPKCDDYTCFKLALRYKSRQLLRRVRYIWSEDCQNIKDPLFRHEVARKYISRYSTLNNICLNCIEDEKFKQNVLIIAWFRYKYGRRTIDWNPYYTRDLNGKDLATIKTLMTLQRIPTTLISTLPNELIFEVFNFYL